jgi:hypothetical protein
MEPRQQKAIEIAAKAKLTRKGDTWLVPSQSEPKRYTVDPNPQAPTCTCPDFEARQLPCKHIFAVEIVVQREYSNDGETEASLKQLQLRKPTLNIGPAITKHRQTRKRTFSRSCMSCALVSKNGSKRTGVHGCHLRTLFSQRRTRPMQRLAADALLAISAMLSLRAT